MSSRIRSFVFALTALLCTSPLGCSATPQSQNGVLNINGVYPHLAMFNSQGECGTGAVVPWAGRLWVVTYSPHRPMGSDDKLYEITPELQQVIRSESVGGTPANRMIHRESNQLIIGNYFIDRERNVRAIQPKAMPGRPTATARHLTDPAGKVYLTTMEEGLYEIDVKTLAIKCWINDSNANQGASVFTNALNSKLPGYHGKGSYTGQGMLLYTNNGEKSAQAKRDPQTPSGALASWGGPGKDWQLILREQFTEITGPGGIYGTPEGQADSAPIWAMGWDHRSLLLMLLEGGEWHLYRMPKSSFSYDGAHGWNTEWPRIREIGTGDDLLATMHGTFWHFPKTFSVNNSAGIAPRSNTLKVVGDFARWGDWVVLGCDDSAKNEFLNTRPSKAKHAAPLRSNSNLWFVKPEQLSKLGPALGSGGVWLEEDVKAGDVSDPYLIAGYEKRMIHLAHRGTKPVTFILEMDQEGNNNWATIKTITVPPNGYRAYIFTQKQAGPWLRITTEQDVTQATAWLHFANHDDRSMTPDEMFTGLATTEMDQELGGVMRSLGGDDVPLGLIVQNRDNTDRPFYLLNKQLELVRSEDKQRRGATWKAAAPNPDSIPLKIEAHSVLIQEDGKRFRLPLNPNRADDKPFGEAIGFARRVREVATERDMVNVGGTFYELPARNAGGFSHIRPIASHPLRLHDFCSWRGLILLTGVDAEDAESDRIIRSADGKAAVWAGVIDDLWKLGKPVGVGGPWFQTTVKADEPSDPYLMYGYKHKSLTLRTDVQAVVNIEVDPSGTGHWHHYAQLDVYPGKTKDHQFFKEFNAHWVRLVSDTDATITATFIYE